MGRAAPPSCTPTAADPSKDPRVATGSCTPLFPPSPPPPAPRKEGWGLFGPVARPTHAITTDCLTVAMAMASTQGCGAAWRLSHGHAAQPPAAPHCTSAAVPRHEAARPGWPWTPSNAVWGREVQPGVPHPVFPPPEAKGPQPWQIHLSSPSCQEAYRKCHSRPVKSP